MKVFIADIGKSDNADNMDIDTDVILMPCYISLDNIPISVKYIFYDEFVTPLMANLKIPYGCELVSLSGFMRKCTEILDIFQKKLTYSVIDKNFKLVYDNENSVLKITKMTNLSTVGLIAYNYTFTM